MPIIDWRVIPHDEHRYESAEDYWNDAIGVEQFRISKMSDPRYEFLLFLHGLFEKRACEFEGIPLASVDAFDINYEKARDDGSPCAPCGCPIQDEPGFDKHAPYRIAHAYADRIERIAAEGLGVNWMEYATEVCALAKTPNR